MTGTLLFMKLPDSWLGQNSVISWAYWPLGLLGPIGTSGECFPIHTATLLHLR